jgi:hypothetical protein
MKLIAEVVEDVKYITEVKENGKKDLYIEGIFLQCEIANRNNRKYSFPIMEKEVKRYNEQYVQKGRALGELGHPEGPTINLDRVSHKIVELRAVGNNFMGKAKIMETPMGNIVRNLINEGVTIGVSSRGMGSLKLNKEGINEVQDDFYLATAADIVADPSAPDAFVNGIMEGVEWCWENNILVAKQAQIEVEKASKAKKLTESRKLAIFQKFLNEISNSSNYK